MELIDNKALKIAVPNDIVERITTAVEKTKVLDTREHLTDLLIHWGPDELTQLNSIVTFKHTLPSPIAQDYKYTGRWVPFDHQKTTSEFLSINRDRKSVV